VAVNRIRPRAWEEPGRSASLITPAAGWRVGRLRCHDGLARPGRPLARTGAYRRGRRRGTRATAVRAHGAGLTTVCGSAAAGDGGAQLAREVGVFKPRPSPAEPAGASAIMTARPGARTGNAERRMTLSERQGLGERAPTRRYERSLSRPPRLSTPCRNGHSARQWTPARACARGQVSGTGMRWSGRPSLARIQWESAVAR
jgi:hypothetical protein